jgi:hypothetical protein
MLTGAQFGLDKKLWEGGIWNGERITGVLEVRPDADRASMIAELGLPASRKNWNNGHFDRWKKACLAITEPSNLEAQLENGEVKRRLFTIGHLLDALEETTAYAVAIVRQMNTHGRIGQPLAEDRAYVRGGDGEKVFFDYAHTIDGEPARKELTLEQLDEDELKKVVVALKKECKRRWPRKRDLLDSVLMRAEHADRERFVDGACVALRCDRLPLLDSLTYEPLVVLLGVVNRIVAERDARTPDGALTEEIDIPW